MTKTRWCGYLRCSGQGVVALPWGLCTTVPDLSGSTRFAVARPGHSDRRTRDNSPQLIHARCFRRESGDRAQPQEYIFMSFKRRAAVTATAAISAVVVGAAPAIAHQCVNPDKKPGA